MVIDFFVVHVLLHADPKFTTHLFVSRMELGPAVCDRCLQCFGSCSLSSTLRDWVVVSAGARFLKNKRRNSRYVEHVVSPFLATLSAIMSGQNLRQAKT
jgi:hypothetical protein